jgi:hypothetical protein
MEAGYGLHTDCGFSHLETSKQTANHRLRRVVSSCIKTSKQRNIDEAIAQP